MNKDLTPNVTIIPDPNSPEAQYFENEATEDNGTEGREENGTAPKPEETLDYWKDRYNQSSRGAEEIARKEKEAQDELRKVRERLNSLEQEKREFERRLSEENPEAYDAYVVKKELETIKAKLSHQDEQNAINDFVSKTPEATQHKDTLQALRRANPDKSLNELYNTMVKPIYEAGIREYEAKKQTKIQNQPETGRGSADKSPVQNDLSEISKLPLEEQKRYFKSLGL